MSATLASLPARGQILGVPTFTFDDTEHAALARLLKQTIATDPFPLSPRVRNLQATLAKLEPPVPYWSTTWRSILWPAGTD